MQDTATGEPRIGTTTDAVLRLEGPQDSQAGRALGAWEGTLYVGGFRSGAGEVWRVDASLSGQAALEEVGRAISGVTEGDGFGREIAASAAGVLVGAPYPHEEAGAVYELDGDDAIEVLASEKPGTWLGRSVAWVEALDDSGDTYRLAGATGADSGAGAAYLWVEPYRLASILEGERHAWAGNTATSGDTDGDGIAELIIGGPGDELGQVAGQVWIWSGTPPNRGKLEDADRVLSAAGLSDVGVGDGFGHGLASGFDHDGDGTDDLLVGAPGAGAVWLFLASETVALAGAVEAEVGYAVAADDETVAVLSRADTQAGDGAGAIHLWTGPLSGTVALDSADVILLGEPGSNLCELVLTADGVLAGLAGHDTVVSWEL